MYINYSMRDIKQIKQQIRAAAQSVNSEVLNKVCQVKFGLVGG